jgi:surface antigen
MRRKRSELVSETAFQNPSATPRTTAPSKNFKHKGAKRLLGVFTALVVPGFLVATSLPAFAIATPPTVEEELLAETGTNDIALQSFSATAEAELSAERGSFTAETHAQVEARKAAAIWSAARNGAYGTVGPRQAGDDYPYRTLSGLSPLRYVARQCTDFVAWRINRDAGSTSAPYKWDWANMTPNGGSASQWANAWRSHGWKTSNTPVRGAVAWFNGNHVAYVKSVSGNSVNLEEYNWNGSASYHTRTIPSSEVALFLYPPP